MCCDSSENTNPVVGECPWCSGPVDEDGDTTEDTCHYSPILCDRCGCQPCDDSC